MKIVVLVENTTTDERYGIEHGLSLYIETDEHRILFDSGDSNLFEINASKMGIDLTSIDIFILSHGHHDHGGGLARFMEINNQAKIYVHEDAFDPHYSKRQSGYKDISVVKPSDVKQRIFYTSDNYALDAHLVLFSKVKAKYFYPSSNQNLYVDDGHSLKNDDFRHEQNLIIEDNQKLYLIAGCAHKGMINIIDEAKNIMGREIDVAIGGLHMYSRSSGVSESFQTIKRLGSTLLSYPTKILTCHCTGDIAFEELKNVMGDQIEYIRTGMKITL